MAMYAGCSWVFPLNIVIFHSYVNLPEGKVLKKNKRIQQLKLGILMCNTHQKDYPIVVG